MKSGIWLAVLCGTMATPVRADDLGMSTAQSLVMTSMEMTTQATGATLANSTTMASRSSSEKSGTSERSQATSRQSEKDFERKWSVAGDARLRPEMAAAVIAESHRAGGTHLERLALGLGVPAADLALAVVRFAPENPTREDLTRLLDFVTPHLSRKGRR